MQSKKEPKCDGIESRISERVMNMKKYEPGSGTEEIKEKYDLDRVIKLSSNENPLGCAGPARECIEGLKFNVARYPDGDCRVLRQELADFYDLEVENIVAGNGSDQIIDLALQLVARPGDEVVMAATTFSQYSLTCQVQDLEEVKVPLDENFRHDLKAMKEAVGPETAAVFICDPNNPTGTTVKASEIRNFLDYVPSDVLVVIDQAYREYVTAPDYFQGQGLLDEYPNMLLLRTFSKIYGLAGLRVGYGLGSPQVMEHMNCIRNPFNVNSLAQAAAAGALNCQDHVERCLEMNSRQRLYFQNQFDKMGIEYIPSQANFILVRTGLRPEEAFEHFASRGVVVRTTESFGLEGWIRFTLPPADWSDFVLEAFGDLARM